MENIWLAVKFVGFLTLELSVLVALGIAVVAGVYQVVRDRVNESRRYDQITPRAA